MPAWPCDNLAIGASHAAALILSRRLAAKLAVYLTLKTRLREGHQRRLGQRLGLLFVVRRLGHVTAKMI